MTRINFTGRRRITRRRVSLHLMAEAEKIRLDVRRIDLDGLSLPSEARVVVEAYQQTTFVRLECGTVGSFIAVRAALLPGFSAPDSILFRVKVVGTGEHAGRILAAADRVPATAIEGAGSRQPLLPFRGEVDAGTLWRLDLDSVPTVVIDAEIGDWHEFARQPYFVSLVYPEVLRQVALWLCLRTEEAADPGSRESNWLRFLRRYGPPPNEVPEDDRSAWADEIAASFARDKRLLSKMQDMLGNSG